MKKVACDIPASYLCASFPCVLSPQADHRTVSSAHKEIRTEKPVTSAAGASMLDEVGFSDPWSGIVEDGWLLLEVLVYSDVLL